MCCSRRPRSSLTRPSTTSTRSRCERLAPRPTVIPLPMFLLGCRPHGAFIINLNVGWVIQFRVREGSVVLLTCTLMACADSVLQRRAGVQGLPGDPQHVQEGAEDHHQRLRGGDLGTFVAGSETNIDSKSRQLSSEPHPCMFSYTRPTLLD
jgi:hypothetical protein